MFVFFDLDGTLNDQDHAERQAAIAWRRRHAATLPHADDAFALVWQSVAQKHIGRFLQGEISYEEQPRARLREILSLSQHDPRLSDEELDSLFVTYREEYARGWRPYPDVADCLARLAGRPLGLISNGDGVEQRRKLESLGLEDRFDPVIISGEVGLSKPDPRVFQKACRQAGREPADCVYIGDQLETDALACQRIGLVGVWINRAGQGPRRRDVIELRSLDELQDLLDRLDG